MAETYAIVESGGKQYRVAAGESLTVDRLPGDEGAKVQLRAVAFRDSDKLVAAPAELEKVKVEAVVAEHLRGEKIRVFKYKAKKGYRRRRGYRSELTRLDVKEVKMLTRKPAAKKDEPVEAKAEAQAKAEAPAKAEAKPEAEAKPKTAPKKPAAAKKPAAKKAAKKPAAKKPAAKKPATKKESDDGS